MPLTKSHSEWVAGLFQKLCRILSKYPAFEIGARFEHLAGKAVYQMYHIEKLWPVKSEGELIEFLKTKCMPYWRNQGFEVKVFSRVAGLGEAPVLLLTVIDRLGDIDSWPERAAGSPEGVRLLAELDELVDHLQASVIQDVEEG